MRADSYGSILRGPVSIYSKSEPGKTGWGAMKNSIIHLQYVRANALTHSKHIQFRLRKREKTAKLRLAGTVATPALFGSAK